MKNHDTLVCVTLNFQDPGTSNFWLCAFFQTSENSSFLVCQGSKVRALVGFCPMSLRPSQRSVFTSRWRSGPPTIWMSSSDVNFLAGSTALCAEFAEVWSIFRGWIGVQSCVRRIMIRRNAIGSAASGPEPVLLQKLSPWQWWWGWWGWSHSSSSSSDWFRLYLFSSLLFTNVSRVLTSRFHSFFASFETNFADDFRPFRSSLLISSGLQMFDQADYFSLPVIKQ